MTSSDQDASRRRPMIRGAGPLGLFALCLGWAPPPRVDVRFNDAGHPFSAADRRVITGIITKAEADVRRLLPALPPTIKVTVTPFDHDLRIVAGVTGSAVTPDSVELKLSTLYPGGAVAAARAGLRRTTFHEFHHLVTGWNLRAIFTDKTFHGGAVTAAVYEGLADVFAIDYTGVPVDDSLAIPADAADWLAEMMALPPEAKWDWDRWMNRNPDGRLAIGYRVGAYVVRRAMERSGKSILELTRLPPGRILELAGAGKG